MSMMQEKMYMDVDDVCAILVFLAAGLYVLVGKVYGEMNYEKIESVASSPMKEEYRHLLRFPVLRVYFSHPLTQSAI